MAHRLRTTIITVAVLATLAVTAAMPAAGAASRADLTKTARKGALVAADFPTGWKGVRGDTTPDATVIKEASKITACEDYVKLRKLTATAIKVRSLEFSDDTNTTVSNVVSAFSSAGKADSAMEYWSGADMVDCLQTYTQNLIDENGGGGTVAVSQADVDELGADAVGYQADISDDSGAIVESLLTIAVPVGQFVDVYTLDVTSPDAPFTTVEDAIKSSLDRLEAAAG